jgi:3-keto-5-aminohexanoate cleavage enzyme
MRTSDLAQGEAADRRAGRAPLSIAVAPNGGRKSRADHPALPLSPAELAVCAEECLAAGASMIHIHVRDAAGRHVLDADLYREAIAAIRARVGRGLLVQITTESLGYYSPAEQAAVLRDVKPEAGSIALREIAPDAAYESAFAELLLWMRCERVVPQIILYDRADLDRLAELRRRGLVPAEDVPVLFVLGRYTASQQSSPADLLEFIASDPRCFSHWSVCAFGRQEAACAVAAALCGGHVRVGFENNLHRPDGQLAAANADLVRPVAESLRHIGLTIETGDGLRGRLATVW